MLKTIEQYTGLDQYEKIFLASAAVACAGFFGVLGVAQNAAGLNNSDNLLVDAARWRAAVRACDVVADSTSERKQCESLAEGALMAGEAAKVARSETWANVSLDAGGGALGGAMLGVGIGSFFIYRQRRAEASLRP